VPQPRHDSNATDAHLAYRRPRERDERFFASDFREDFRRVFSGGIARLIAPKRESVATPATGTAYRKISVAGYATRTACREIPVATPATRTATRKKPVARYAVRTAPRKISVTTPATRTAYRKIPVAGHAVRTAPQEIPVATLAPGTAPREIYVATPAVRVATREISVAGQVLEDYSRGKGGNDSNLHGQGHHFTHRAAKWPIARAVPVEMCAGRLTHPADCARPGPASA
jgi:hypothetical protein